MRGREAATETAGTTFAAEAAEDAERNGRSSLKL
jgi:hypothetical protein